MSEAAPATVTEATKEVEKSKQTKGPKKVFVRATHGEMLHLFTGVRFTADPKKVELDSFTQAQIDAGKLEVVTLND